MLFEHLPSRLRRDGAGQTREDLVRQQVAALIAGEKAYDVPAVCVDVGLQAAVGPEDSQEAFQGKLRYVLARVDALDRTALLAVARRLHARRPDFLLGEALARVEEGRPTISELTRRALLDELELSVGLETLGGRLGLVEFLRRVWPLDALPSRDHRFSHAAGEIWQHTENNPGDYALGYLLAERLDLLASSDRQFLRFVEELVHPVVRDGDAQRTVADALNAHLAADGWRLVVCGDVSGRPVYRAERAGAAGPVKNLIFASAGPKPDLVLADALANDVRIVRHAEHCLVYDAPIPAEGLRWADLVRWWAARPRTLTPDAREQESSSERALYERLAASLDDAVERPFFRRYFATFQPLLGERLPALVPQVYLHYDPRTVRERAGMAAAWTGDSNLPVPLPRQRMDFLLLLRGNVRVVLELDGKHHYAKGDVASPGRYAAMVSADRDLRLAGYEVFRFGGAELRNGQVANVVDPFFRRLFARHGIA